MSARLGIGNNRKGGEVLVLRPSLEGKTEITLLRARWLNLALLIIY